MKLLSTVDNRLLKVTLEKVGRNLKRDRRTSTLGSNVFSLDDNQGFIKKMKSVLQNKIFLCLCLSLTGNYFVITGIQYWTPDYLHTIIG